MPELKLTGMWLGDTGAHHIKTSDSLQVEMTVYVLMDVVKVTTSKNKNQSWFSASWVL